MKRFFALVLALLLCLPSLGFAIDAADPQIVLASAEGSPGEQVTVVLSISGNTGLAYLKLKVGYDSDVLTLVSTDNTGLLGGIYTTSETIDVNPYVLQWLAAGNSTGDGVIATLTFTIGDTAAAGDQTVTLSFEECYDEALNDVAFAVVPGVITVKQTAASADGISIKEEDSPLQAGESETLTAVTSPDDTSYEAADDDSMVPATGDGSAAGTGASQDTLQLETVSNETRNQAPGLKNGIIIGVAAVALIAAAAVGILLRRRKH